MYIRKVTGFGLMLAAAGADSVSNLSEFTIHALSLHPEYQSRIRKEVQDAMKKHGVSEFNYKVIRELTFTFQCIFEAARLFPVGSMLFRQCIQGFQIPGTNYTINEGDKVMVPIYSINRDETLFKDPHQYKPERFNSNNDTNTNLSIPPTLLSFGTGPRKCPGYKHGIVVAASMVSSIICKYDIKPSSHLKLMDATDFHPKGVTFFPRTKLVVDLIPNNSGSL